MTRFADREIPAGVSYRQLDHWCRQGWISKLAKIPDGVDRRSA